MINGKRLYSFSQPNSFKLVAAHGEKFIYLLILTTILLTYQDLKGQFLIDVIILISILILILIIVGRFTSQVIWRFDVDFDNKKILFYICKKASPIDIAFYEIDQIKVSGPIVFFVGPRKFYYSTNQYKEILIILHNVKKISWGKMCNILGPNKSIREDIDSEQLKNRGAERLC